MVWKFFFCIGLKDIDLDNIKIFKVIVADSMCMYCGLLLTSATAGAWEVIH